MLLFWHSLLSNGLVATESRRASCPLSDSLVQSNKGLTKLGMLLLFLHQVKENRRPTPPASASSMNGTGRFWISVPTRTTRCCPIHSWATGFLADIHRVFWFPRSSRTDFVREPFLNLSTSSWALHTRSSKIILCSSFDSEVDFNFRLFLIK